jgi:hypothetical protein
VNTATTPQSTSTSGRTVTTIALVGLCTWPTIVVVLQIVQGSTYHPLVQAASELSRGRGGILMALAFTALGAGTTAFAYALRAATGARVAPVLLVLSGFCDIVSAIFRADLGATHTVSGHIHDTTGIVTFVLIIAAMFAAIRPLRRSASFGTLAWWTLGWAVTAVGAFFLFPILGDAHFGLAQRIFIASWLSWLIATTVAMHRLNTATTAAATSAGANSTERVLADR